MKKLRCLSLLLSLCLLLSCVCSFVDRPEIYKASTYQEKIYDVYGATTQNVYQIYVKENSAWRLLDLDSSYGITAGTQYNMLIRIYCGNEFYYNHKRDIAFQFYNGWGSDITFISANFFNSANKVIYSVPSSDVIIGGISSTYSGGHYRNYNFVLNNIDLSSSYVGAHYIDIQFNFISYDTTQIACSLGLWSCKTTPEEVTKDDLQNSTDSITDGLTGLPKKIADAVGGFFSSLGDVFTGGFIDLGEIFEFGFDALPVDIKNALSGFFSDLSQGLSDLKKNIESLPSLISSKFQDFFSNISDNLNSLGQRIIDSYSEFVSMFIDALTDFFLPDNDYLKEYYINLDDLVKSRFGALYQASYIIGDFFEQFEETTAKESIDDYI